MNNLERFLERLHEAIAWCAPRADVAEPKTCLRTPDLLPQLLTGKRWWEVETVVSARHWALGFPESSPATEMAGGRLLAFEPDVTLTDGAAQVATQDYFDAYNVPPWDTWVDYVTDADGTSYLVTWVPAPFVEIVGDGIEANPEECIWWLSQRNTELTRKLREAGLL